MVEKVKNLFMSAIESLTGYFAVISSDHAYIHKGLAFTALINTGSISGAYKIGFVTPTVASGKYVHWRPTGITSSANYVSTILYEGDAFTSGTAVTPINRNRNSISTSLMQSFVKNATVTPAGTIIDLSAIGTSGNPTATMGGGSKADEEIILKPNTSYVMLLTPAGATTVELKLFWYEEERGTI